jgi:aspartate 1-decarboxylase
MLVKMLKSKLHGATVTETKLRYPGSIAIDSALMKAAKILPYESVLVADVNNGNRLETYAVPAEANSGKIVVLGAAAKLVKPKDTVIILSFGYCTLEEAGRVKPKVVILDKDNKIKDDSQKTDNGC